MSARLKWWIPSTRWAFQAVGNAAYLGQQFLVSHLGHFAAIGFKNQGNLVTQAGIHVLVQAIGRNIQFARGIYRRPASARWQAVAPESDCG